MTRTLSILLLLASAACVDRVEEVGEPAPTPAAEANGEPPAGASEAEPDPPPMAERDPDSGAAGWTVDAISRAHSPGAVVSLEEVRAAGNEGFDRFVVVFAGDEMPSWRVEYVDRPARQCGSGEPVHVEGGGLLMVRLEPARAHDDRGEVTIEERHERHNLPVLRETRILCDFEAQVDWVLGVRAPTPFRVLELTEPTRLVIDVREEE